MPNKRLTGLFAGLLTLALGSSLATAADAAPKPPKPKPAYVALGDSYAAGEGAGSYLADGTGCDRSLLGYPGLVAANGNLTLDLQACAGAVVSDVSALQLATLTTSTAYVTITVGGNDIGFADVMTTCLGTNTTACLNAVAAAEGVATSVLPGRLANLFSVVKTLAPNAKITATSYPLLFNGRNCSLWTSFTPDEMTALNAGSDLLAWVIQQAADVAGIDYADVRQPFTGHAICDAAPWIHNVEIFSQDESFHPNADGYRYGYTPGVMTSLGVSSTTKPGRPKVTTGGQTSTDTERGRVEVDPSAD